MLLSLAFALSAFAMKPAPFTPGETIRFVDPTTQYSVKSTQAKGDGYDEKGETIVINSHRRPIWSAPIFTGRRQINLSPDGRYLLLTGNFYFGLRLHVSDEEEPAILYEKGKLLPAPKLIDLYSDVKHYAREKKLPVLGGGWVGFKDLVSEVQADWQNKELLYTLPDGSHKAFAFDCSGLQDFFYSFSEKSDLRAIAKSGEKFLPLASRKEDPQSFTVAWEKPIACESEIAKTWGPPENAVYKVKGWHVAIEAQDGRIKQVTIRK